MSSSQPVRIDLHGVVSYLRSGGDLASRDFLRELLLNGEDAIVARRGLCRPDPGWGIRVVPPSDRMLPFQITDDGIGHTADDVSNLFHRVGTRSVADLLRRSSVANEWKFGLRLLSCLLVTDEVVVRSRSARMASAVVWRCDSDGKCSISPVDYSDAARMPVGTTVEFVARADQWELVSADSVLMSAVEHASSVPVDVYAAGRWNRVTL